MNGEVHAVYSGPGNKAEGSPAAPAPVHGCAGCEENPVHCH